MFHSAKKMRSTSTLIFVSSFISFSFHSYSVCVCVTLFLLFAFINDWVIFISHSFSKTFKTKQKKKATKPTKPTIHILFSLSWMNVKIQKSFVSRTYLLGCLHFDKWYSIAMTVMVWSLCGKWLHRLKYSTLFPSS